MTQTATMTPELSSVPQLQSATELQGAPQLRSAGGPQRMRALERANAVRLARAELKRRIAHGHLSAAEVILRLPAEARSWPVGELLMSQRRWGSNRTRKLLSGLQISEMRHLSLLTERQRRLLATQLGAPAVDELDLAPCAPLEGYIDGNGMGAREQEKPHGETNHGYGGAHDEHRFEHNMARVVEPSCLAVGAIDVA